MARRRRGRIHGGHERAKLLRRSSRELSTTESGSEIAPRLSATRCCSRGVQLGITDRVQDVIVMRRLN